MGRGNESLYKWSRSQDQDGRLAHILKRPSKSSSSEPEVISSWNLACTMRSEALQSLHK